MKRRVIHWLLLGGIPVLVIVGAVGCALLQRGQEPTIHLATPIARAQDGGVALTVYNEGTALVRDTRTFALEEGINEINFADVAAMIDPTSVHFNSLTDPSGTVVLEQNYAYDLVSTDALLERYLDNTIQIVTEDGTSYEGQLLSGRSDVVLQRSNGEVVVIPRAHIRDFAFPELPEGLIVRPTLVWQILAEQAADHTVDVTYLTGGITWRADYTLLLAQTDDSLDLEGWVTMTNTSGATYEDVHLKLIAGDLNRLRPDEMMPMMFEAEEAGGGAARVAEREFFEYHLYEVERPVTVRDNETKQIEFVRATGVPADRIFVYDSLSGWFRNYGYRPITDPYYGVGQRVQVAVMVEFNTGEENGLGVDLPAGNVRVYQEDIDGAALLIGEDTIDHTPEGETVRLYVGDAFDIVGERVQTDFQLPDDHTVVETYEITLRNHKDEETVEVRLVERLFRWSNWEITRSNMDYVQLDSSTIEFRVELEPGEEQTVHYTVRYTWPDY